MSSRNACISDVESGTEPEEAHMRKIFSATIFLTPAMKLVLIPNELLIIRMQNICDRPYTLRLEVTDFVVQLLADMLSSQFRRTG